MMLAAAKVLACFALGDAAVALSGLPVPGAAIGLLALLASFAPTGGPDPETAALFDRVVAHAPVLFVPAGAGLFADPALLGANAALLVLAVAAGTLVTLAVTGAAATLAIAAFARRGRHVAEPGP
ncbi:CidA/LrgA family protein [Salinarimonas sp.]|uniref:CidA/LrgA family protein n=1 Tax=Salinarimonas sp. TaxID=2766526 RepID=UPI0032D8E417